MFKKSKFIFSGNFAIAQLGIDPLTLDGNLRSSVLSAAFESGASPEEAAVYLFFRLPIAYQPMGAEAVIGAWIQEGKVSQDTYEAARDAIF